MLIRCELAYHGGLMLTAYISLPLFAEYEAVLSRPETRRRCPLTAAEQTQLLDAFLSRTRLVEVYYRWRPNLPDEGSWNHRPDAGSVAEVASAFEGVDSCRH
jgi:hypothetical protein